MHQARKKTVRKGICEPKKQCSVVLEGYPGVTGSAEPSFVEVLEGYPGATGVRSQFCRL